MREWDLFLDRLKVELPGCFAQSWTTGYRVIRFDAQNLYLEFTDPFAYVFFKEHLVPQLKKFTNPNGHLIRVHAQAPLYEKKGESFFQKPTLELETSSASFPTFDTFLEDEANRFLINLIKNLPSSVTPFNPLFLYGAKGSGKTHLLQATAKYYQSENFNAVYISLERFSEQLVYAMRHSLMSEFRKFYRAADILLVDDIHKLASKNATQEEFFHTFNTLHMTQKPIVMSSIFPPSELKDIEPRLISRFEWGLSLELQKLTPSSFPNLLSLHAKNLGLDLDQPQQEELLKHFGTDPSRLIQALQALTLRLHLNEHKPDSNLIETLSDLEETPPLTLDEITEVCAQYFKIKSKDLKGASQVRTLAFPRQLTMYLTRKWLKLPYKKIGQHFDRDHSTVMASITLIEEKLKQLDEETLGTLKRIEWELKKK